MNKRFLHREAPEHGVGAALGANAEGSSSCTDSCSACFVRFSRCLAEGATARLGLRMTPSAQPHSHTTLTRPANQFLAKGGKV